MGKGGQHFPVTLQSYSHITPTSAAGRNAVLTRVPAKIHPWKQQRLKPVFQQAHAWLLSELFSMLLPQFCITSSSLSDECLKTDREENL